MTALFVGLACLAGATGARAQAIDIFPVVGGATDFGNCSASVQPLSGTLHIGVYVRLGGLIDVSGAECFIYARQGGVTGPVLDLQSQGWTFSVTADPLAAAPTGDPINRRGTEFRGSLGFAVDPATGFCNRGANGFVHLWDIAIFNATNNNPIPDNTYLTVGAAGPPGGFGFNCPLVTHCNPPSFTLMCVRGGAFILNPSGRTCLVAVEERSWSMMKGVYR